MDTFERIQSLRDDYESALDDAERLRDDYHREIVKLHRSGMSLREIAQRLGISHQRVHQIVSPHEKKPRTRARHRAVAGATGVVLLLGGAAFLLLHNLRGPERASVPPHRSAPVLGVCAVAEGLRNSAFAPVEMSANCQKEGAVVVLDPETGRVLAMFRGDVSAAGSLSGG